MAVRALKEGIYWVGAIDWDIREFHGPSYSTHQGTSYNAYLIIDEKVTLVDIVDVHFVDVMIDHIKEIIDPGKIDYIIINASSKLFDDENDMCTVMDEAKKYYANILMPFSSLVVKKIEEIKKMDLKIDMIAPSHGILWRSHPDKILEAYMKWGRGETHRKAIIVYETMWNSTERMARAVIEGLVSEGVDARLYRISVSDINDIIKEVLDAKALLAASSTINNTMIANMAYFMEELMGLKPRNKIGAVFGSYGWGKGAVANIEKKLREAGIQLVKEGLQIKYVPTEEDLKTCYEFGKEIGKMI
ncbi:Flavodoxin [Geosporobacter subterraneus DSM 17957]|uniref:Flavodoxin n=1 Tax=Geosporobacter subterraneus DSM 17957 TaxID=1121919 RepID=A0A1M6KV23_9FIRM|nr:flavodoxin domain-containing protein [Geosporobacter subterraneus]SHJ62712.1 Flavodoxin [Geosporobacter subterraneus DSM 17957]